MRQTRDKALCASAITVLKGNRRYLSPQEFRTLKGQILAGDINGAMKGLETKLQRRDKE